MKLAEKDRLVFIGDSITDCGRRQPVGEGSGALGGGYVGQVDALLTSVYPDLGVRVFNVGTSGHTIRDLKARWQRDVRDLAPDWLSIMIGINDVWRQFDRPLAPESHVYLEEYATTLRELVEQTRPSLKGLVLMTPYYIEPNRTDVMRAAMDRYGQAVQHVAAEHDAIFVDTQAPFDAVLRHLYPGVLAGDRVHPNAAGHMVLTRAFLSAIGFEWSRRTLGA